MKIKKKGNFFVAHRDENDKNSPDGVGMNSRIKVGDSLGKIHIETGQFSGNTVCLTLLRSHRDDQIQELVDKCIERIKEDVAIGDLTAIDELLKFLPTKYLKGYLPED
ncbi:MAG: hypothetical protein AABY15_06660 [Nanoarchaeota archaeon]